MKFLEKYNTYKQKYLISEGSFNKLLPILQNNYLCTSYPDKKQPVQYNDLNDSQKKDVQSFVEWLRSGYTKYVNELSSNPQYQSWIYDRLYDLLYHDAMNSETFEHYRYMSSVLASFNVICRSPKITNEQKNIFNYKTFEQLDQFVKSFLKEHSKNINPKFKNVFQGKYWTVYKITKADKDLFQIVYGENGYDCGWCVVHPDNLMFEHYLKLDNDCYYLIVNTSTKKPFGLLHFNSNQFKDIHNNPFTLSQFSEDQLQEIYQLLSTTYYDLTNIHLKDSLSKKDVYNTNFSDLSPFYDKIIVNIYSKDQLLKTFLPNCYYNDSGLLNSKSGIYSNQLKYFVKDHKLTLNFNTCEYCFDCDDLGLTTLDGVPSAVFHTFNCSLNNIQNLKNGPVIVDGDYIIEDCTELTSLEGIAKHIGEYLYISHCDKLTSIDFIPDLVKAVEISNCPNLTDIHLLAGLASSGRLKKCTNIGLSHDEMLEQLEILE